MHPFFLSSLFNFFITEENDQRVVEFKLDKKVTLLVPDGKSPEQLMHDPNYQLGIIDAFISPLMDAKSVILTGDRNGLRRKKAEKVEKQWAARDALVAELDAIKAKLEKDDLAD